ncbi:hypothetical protein [Sphingomonas sp. Leaf412]|uniref:hypothetical protein n=1 Tax=Sphingomonas sp. Leaf412 TaxID=1736370 RepID=UPI0012E340B6|nr:hypothetical protein [Sphingomonas sp. Leaf412]
MPRSDRSLIVAAIFGLVAIPFGAGLAIGGEWTSKPYEQTQKPHASAKRYATKPLDSGFAAYPIVESNRCYSAKDHDSADLCAQWRAAIAAEKAASSAAWSNYLSVIGAVLSLAGLAFLLRSLSQTELALKQAKIANQIAADGVEAQMRAWVDISLDLNMRHSPFAGDFVRALVKFRNKGSTPALNLSYFLAITTTGKLVQEVDRIRDDFFSGDLDWSDYIIFPSDDFERHTTGENTAGHEGLSGYVVYVVAVYETVFSKTKRITARAWNIHDARRDDYLIDPTDPPSQQNVAMGLAHGFAGYAT